MKDSKDYATMELPGFESGEQIPARQDRNHRSARSAKMEKQVQLDLLEIFGPTDRSGLPAWVNDDNLDLSGLPVWR